MYTPGAFGRDLIDELFNGVFELDEVMPKLWQTKDDVVSKMGTMKVDIQEFDDKYQMDIELPGYAKEDIKADVKNGYLTVIAERNVDNVKEGENGKYLRKERFVGRSQRSFYVGDEIKKEDIKASYRDGILKLTVPKKDVTEVVEESYIAIED